MKRNKAWFHFFAYHACAGFTMKIVCWISCIPFLACTSSPSFSLSKKQLVWGRAKYWIFWEKSITILGYFIAVFRIYILDIQHFSPKKKDLTYSLLLILVFRKIGRENHLFILSGKPNRLMFDIVRKRHPSVDPSRTLMIGDRWRNTECSE